MMMALAGMTSLLALQPATGLQRLEFCWKINFNSRKSTAGKGFQAVSAFSRPVFKAFQAGWSLRSSLLKALSLAQFQRYIYY
jgi:hypothetical protein